MIAQHIVHYFAYGSNMNPDRVAQRGLSTVNALPGVLSGFRLVFNKMSRDHAGVGHANIEWDRHCDVEGVLYELHNADEIAKMDPYERAPWNYGREVVEIAHGQQLIWAWTYFANPAVKTVGLLPPKGYMDHLLAGDDFLSRDYANALRQHPTHG